MARIEKRVLSDGSTRYKAIIRRKGHPLKTKTCRTRAQAVAWVDRALTTAARRPQHRRVRGLHAGRVATVWMRYRHPPTRAAAS